MENIPILIPTALFSQPNGAAGVAWADNVTSAGPWSIASTSSAAIRSGFANGASFSSLSSTVPGFSAPSFNTEEGTFHTPQYQEWNLQIEQQLDSKSSMSLAYVGNHGFNQPVLNYPNAIAGVAGIPATPYNGSFATVGQIYSAGVSNYNGLTASYQRRMTYGFTVQASYSWGHALDTVSNGGILPYSSISLSYQINPYCLRCNKYGNADYDIRNSFNALYTWQTPWKFSNKFVNGALGGWTLSQDFFVHSGLPLTVLDSTTGIGNYNGVTPYFPAQVVGPGQGNCGPYLTTCLISSGFAPASGLSVFPNQVRNQYRGPGFFDSDFTVNKNFKLTERVAFGVGANFYNVFNHPNFAQPVDTFGASNFGSILNTTAPPTGPYGSFFVGSPSGRIVQFQGKLVF